VGQKGTHSHIWAPIGAQPLMVRDNRHESAYLFGAICPDRAVGAAIIMPQDNAEAMSEHLAEISTQGGARRACRPALRWCRLAPDRRTPPRARQHHAAALPELNCMENVWHYLRENTLCALVWDSYDAIVEVCVTAWQFLINDPDRIRSIGTRKWARAVS